MSRPSTYSPNGALIPEFSAVLHAQREHAACLLEPKEARTAGGKRTLKVVTAAAGRGFPHASRDRLVSRANSSSA